MDQLLQLLAVAGGLVLLVVGAEGLVRGASRLALAAGVTPVVIGLTVVAFGTSAPELAVSVGAALTGEAEVALGNAIGSNVFNVLAVVGVAALFGSLVVHQRVVRIDVPLLVVVTGGLWWAAADGTISALEGGALVAGLLAYTVLAFLLSRDEPSDVVAEYEEAIRDDPEAAKRTWPAAAGILLAGLAGLVLGAQLLVGGATGLAEGLGVPDVVVGLTVVAIGTSLPELVTSVVAVRRGELDIAVGNVVGSNLFNVLGVVGLAGLLSGGLEVPDQVLSTDLPVVALTTLVALPVLATGLLVRRWEGALLVVGYLGYTGLQVLLGTGSDAAGPTRTLLLVGLAAIAAATLLVGLRARARRPPDGLGT